ncbi:DEAD/DEAH box helicase, partial [Chloroflexota bacterium]
MLTLKNYQQACLDQLQAYIHLVDQHGAKVAFVLQTERSYREVANLPQIPYVCLRVPTGGGKTIMACHSLGILARDYLHQEQAVYLWLVPSNVIREQTLKALRDRNHPYRQAIDAQFSSVSIMDLADALYIQRNTLEGDACIIVSTLAALRVEDTEGRKIYESSGALQHHFTGLSPALVAKLQKDANGILHYSLANVLRLWAPVVIMDEAHNARTKLSFETLERFSPSCIVEFTATPQTEHDPERGKYASNILAHVSAAQLKAEHMIKLPIKLHTRPDWKEVLSDTIRAQGDLEELAAQEQLKTGEYIRPIVLIQAQPHRQERNNITAEVVKDALLNDCKVPEEQIAVATGAIREIEDVDLSDSNCPIRFIITQQALKEGWDCPFAYVFCSVADVGSTRDVEQLLGRVLRLPGAKTKQHEELNRAYAMVSSQRFLETIQNLREALVENGFERIEASQFLAAEAATLKSLGQLPLFAPVQIKEKITEVPD